MQAQGNLCPAGESLPKALSVLIFECMSSSLRLLTILALSALEVSAQDPFNELMGLSLEDLMGVEVSLASRSEQPLSEVAGAVHILSRDDIRRSGATSIPELLRLVPGMQVARIDANKWAISARGFNERFANKLLVQIDGRTVYTPAFSGVYWEELDVVLPDIERIEVIRGPGAALWGANAVNGIVNIVTQTASQTQGVLVQASYGDEDHAIVSLRQGGRIGTQGHYRVFAKVRDHDAARDTTGADARDGWSMARAGSRLDWTHSRLGDFHLQAEAMVGDLTNQVSLPQLQAPSYRRLDDVIRVVGAHALGRWDLQSENGDSWTAQVFYNVQDREEFVDQRVQSFDIDLQNRHQHGTHALVWGGGFRITRERFSQPLALSVSNVSPSEEIFSLFLQDDISLATDLHLILGSKFEHNDFTGLEVQPTARVRWSPGDRVTWWGSLSRAVRTPTSGERAVRVILPGASLPPSLLPDEVQTGFAAITGGPDFDSEALRAAEVGLRTLAASWLLVDVSAFFHDYTDLRSLQQGNAYIDSSLSEPVLILPLSFRNTMAGTSHGLEAAADVRLGTSTRLRLHYAYLEVDLKDFSAAFAEREEGTSPAHQAYLNIRHDLGQRLSLDGALRYVDALSAPDVKAYAELDARLGYRPVPDVDLHIAVHNALSSRHQEYAPVSLHSSPALIERSLQLGVTWRY